jgi:hypothetical protein
MSQPSPAESDEPVAELALLLRELQVRAGKPSILRLAELTGLPRSTIQDKLAGKTAPTSVEQVLALVRACAVHAGKERIPLPAADTDMAAWREAWNTMQLARLAPRRQRYRAARASAALSATSDTGRQPETAPRPAPAHDEAARKADDLIYELVHFRSTPEQLHYIGHTLVACEAFFDECDITDPQARALIDEISDELADDEGQGRFGPVISVRKIRELIKRLRSIRQSIAAARLHVSQKAVDQSK